MLRILALIIFFFNFSARAQDPQTEANFCATCEFATGFGEGALGSVKELSLILSDSIKRKTANDLVKWAWLLGLSPKDLQSRYPQFFTHDSNFFRALEDQGALGILKSLPANIKSAVFDEIRSGDPRRMGRGIEASFELILGAYGGVSLARSITRGVARGGVSAESIAAKTPPTPATFTPKTAKPSAAAATPPPLRPLPSRVERMAAYQRSKAAEGPVTEPSPRTNGKSVDSSPNGSPATPQQSPLSAKKPKPKVLGPMKFKDLHGQLKTLGYERQAGGHGGHLIYVHPETGARIPVPRHGSGEVKRFTARNILQRAVEGAPKKTN